jgi:hypothetical protein
MDDQASPEYLIDMSHPSPASSQASTCSVEPGSAEDVSKIVSHLYPTTHKLFSDEHFTASYSGINPNAFWGEKWGAQHEPGVFLDERRRDRDDTLQRDEGQFHEWHS